MEVINIAKHRLFLEDRIDTDHGLLDKLYSNEVLSKRETLSLRSADAGDRSEKLLDFILEKNKKDELVAALSDTGQKHLVNYLKADGEYIFEFGDDWPLVEREQKILRINHESLVDLIETCDLCGLLYSKEVINRRQNELISSKATQSERNEVLLDVLGRISRKKFKTTIECLHSSNQRHIAEILSEGGVVVPIHANAVGLEEGQDISEEEEAIALGISRLLGDRPLQESDRLWELARLKLIAAKTGQSVVLYFHCRTLKDLTRLMVVLTSGHLRRLVEIAFNDLWPSDDFVSFALRLDDDFYENCQIYFSVIKRKIVTRISMEEKRNPHTTLYELPLEILDIILLKVCLATLLNENKNKNDALRDADIVCSIASVDQSFTRILKTRFKKRVMRHLSEFYRKTQTIKSRFVRNGSEYLAENTRHKGRDLVDRLRSADCLTDREARFVNGQQHDRDKNEELLKVIATLDTKRYNGFVYCLLQTRQPFVALVAECGGREGLTNYKEDPILIHTIEINEAKAVTGITIVDDELFVTNDRSSEVKVYDSTTFTFNRSWTLAELVNPMDIGFCRRNHCLYIVDWKEIGQPNEFFRVDKDGTILNRWSTGVDYGRLSVTDESNVVLAVYNKNKLLEYSPEGRLIREINLSSKPSIEHPWHAIKLTDGHYVVSHGYLNDGLHGVCLVDVDGNVIKSFGRGRGSGRRQLNVPLYSALDKDGSIMVIDRGNRRMVLLSSCLEFKREILSKAKHGLRYPLRIYLDESDGRLFVADSVWNKEEKTWKDARVLIFRIK